MWYAMRLLGSVRIYQAESSGFKFFIPVEKYPDVNRRRQLPVRRVRELTNRLSCWGKEEHASEVNTL